MDHYSKLINLTPHQIVIYDEDGERQLKIYPPSGEIARAGEVTSREAVLLADGVEVVFKRYGDPVGLPEQEEGVAFIVSGPVMELANRADLICPDTGPDSVVRDDEGNILGVKRFFQYA